VNNELFRESDPFSPITYSYKINNVLYSGKSRYQEIQVLDSPEFGKMLALDGVVQLTERDEFFYHEMLAHVALHTHLNPKYVLIIGGGDGGTLREVIKHESVKHVQLVELDKEVIAISKRYFPSLSVGFSDTRVQIKEMDGSRFVSGTTDRYDVVIVDSTDPVGSAKSLFSEQFFNDVRSILNDDGILVIQTESLHFHRKFVIEIQQRLGKLFEIVSLYTVPLATYAGNWWTFSIASRKYLPDMLNRKHTVSTRYYDEQVHKNAFLPETIYKKLMSGKLDW
jgi:spermidine synthase